MLSDNPNQRIIKEYIRNHYLSFENWLQRLSPALEYHFRWSKDLVNLVFVGTYNEYTDTFTWASSNQHIL